MAFNLTQTGADIGGFLTELKEPLPDFIMAMGLALGIVGLVLAIIFLIKKYATKIGGQ